jgi:hypothetical protein
MSKHAAATIFILVIFATTVLVESSPPQKGKDGGQPMPGPVKLSVPTIAVDQLKRGMKGYALTVFEGNKVERVDAEVISVVRNGLGPKQDLILCRFSGDKIEHTGIAGGMSGSPVYIEEKLAGAISMGWPFIKEPICGVQPINQMKDVRSWKPGEAVRWQAGIPGLEVFRQWAFLRLKEVDEKTVVNSARRLLKIQNKTFHAESLAGMRPLALPVYINGFGSRADEILKQALEGTTLKVAGVGGNPPEQPADMQADIKPGGIIGIPLISGDFQMEAIGTVTAVNEKQVLAFGHAFFGGGPVEFPIASGVIHTVIPSLMISFKLGSAGPIVGTLTSDETTGVYGTVGPKPKLIDAEIRNLREDLGRKEEVFSIRLVQHRQLTPVLVMWAVGRPITSQAIFPPEFTLYYTVEMDFGKAGVIEFENKADDTEWAKMLLDIQSISASVLNNPFESALLKGIKVRSRVVPKKLVADIEEVWLASPSSRPGEKATIFVKVKPYRGPSRILSIPFAIPDDFPEGTYTLEICNWSGHLARMLAAKPQLLQPYNLKQMIETANILTRVPRDGLYARLTLPPQLGAGLASKGEEWANLPPAKLAVLGGAELKPGNSATPFAQGFLESLESHIETPYLLNGMGKVSLSVEKTPNQ